MSEKAAQGRSEHGDKNARPVVQKQKVYGRGHALTIEAQVNRAGEQTLCFEFAAARNGAERQYDWDDKLAIQLKPDHLPLYAAALLGDLASLRLDHYGAERNKSLEVETLKEGVIAIKGFSRGRGHPVPVVPERLFWLGVQAIGRICDGAQGAVDSITVRAMIRRAAEMWEARANAKRSNS